MRNADDNIQDKGLPTDEERVSRLLGTLKRVESPGDFGFRVKARIATARSSTGASWLPASVAVAAPLGLVLAVGGYFALTSFYLPATVSPPPVAEIKPANLAPSQMVPDPINIQNTGSDTAGIEPGVETSQPMVVKPSDVDNGIMMRPAFKRTGSRTPSSGPGGGSVDETGKIGHEVFPIGVNQSRRNTANIAEIGTNGSLRAKEALSAMGVDANYSGTAWTVGSVKKDSPAEHSGLKAGDVVEAINDKPLTDKTSFGGKFTGKSVRVRRDGKSIQIDLKP